MRALCLLLAALSISLALQAPDDELLALPDGDVARAWASVGPETEPVDPAQAFAAEAAWLFAADSPLESDERWPAWAAWLVEARTSDSGRARAGLALLALREERWTDLWRHVAALGAHPDWLAGVMPACLPGAPLALAPRSGGRAGLLAEGALLTPALPPAGALDPFNPYTRTASVRTFEVGETTVSLSLQVEPSGVQVDLQHLAGPPTRLSVRMPAPEHFDIVVEYVDWMRQDAVRAALPVELVPGAEPVTLFARGRPRQAVLPASPIGDLPAGLRLAGLALVPARDGEALPVLAAAAAGLERVLSVPVRVGAPSGSGELAPTLVHLPREADAQLALLALLSARVEAFLLRETARSR